MADRLTGKASYFILGGVTIPITKVTPKVTRKLADTTDSGDYNSTNDLLFNTQLVPLVTTEFAVEGRFRKSVTPAAVIAQLYFSNVGGLSTVFGMDASTIWGHGPMDVSDFQTDSPVDDTVNFTCNMKSNGFFTPNA